MSELIENIDIKEIKWTHMTIGHRINIKMNFTWILYKREKENGCEKKMLIEIHIKTNAQATLNGSRGHKTILT